MVNKYLLVPTLTGALIAFSPGIATGVKSTYGAIFNPKGGIEEVVQASKRNLEGMVGGVAYAQDKLNGKVDYDALGKQAYQIDSNKNPHKVISLLERYKDDSDNKSVGFFNNLALAFNKVGRYNDAVALFERAMQYEPNDSLLFYNLAGVHYRHKRFDKALEAIEKSLEIKPDYKDAQEAKEKILKELRTNNKLK